MNPNRHIRIIKSAQRAAERSAAEGKAQNGGEKARSSGLDAASRVGAWVKEFKQRRNVDPRRAFASLFAEPAHALNQSS
jgi:hypothetical protein